MAVAATTSKAKRFNIGACGSWRLAFLLARIQRTLWEQEELPPSALPKFAMSPLRKMTPEKRLLRRRSSAEGTPRKRKLGGSPTRRSSNESKVADSPTKRKLGRKP